MTLPLTRSRWALDVKTTKAKITGSSVFVFAGLVNGIIEPPVGALGVAAGVLPHAPGRDHAPFRPKTFEPPSESGGEVRKHT